MKEKKSTIQELEQRLSTVSEESSAVGSKYEHTIVSLKAELETVRNTLTMEQTMTADKDATIERLEREKKEDLKRIERLSGLEKKVSTLQRALGEVQAEKDAQADELAKLNEERQRDIDSLQGSARQIALEKEEISKQVQQKETQIKELENSHAAAIAELKENLSEEISTKSSLQSEVEKLKESLKAAVSMSESRSEDSYMFQQRINELEEQIEEQRQSVAKNVTDYQETVAQLRQQLADARTRNRKSPRSSSHYRTKRMKSLKHLNRLSMKCKAETRKLSH